MDPSAKLAVKLARCGIDDPDGASKDWIPSGRTYWKHRTSGKVCKGMYQVARHLDPSMPSTEREFLGYRPKFGIRDRKRPTTRKRPASPGGSEEEGSEGGRPSRRRRHKSGRMSDRQRRCRELQAQIDKLQALRAQIEQVYCDSDGPVQVP
jgi:hypothetical protein